ncbi:MAG: hypothetical protein ACYDC9_07135 [Dermatophilaceae bacterium]
MVIVSNDGANATADRLGRGVVSVVPLTSTVTHVYRHSRLPVPGHAPGCPDWPRPRIQGPGRAGSSNRC